MPATTAATSEADPRTEAAIVPGDVADFDEGETTGTLDELGEIEEELGEKGEELGKVMVELVDCEIFGGNSIAVALACASARFLVRKFLDKLSRQHDVYSHQWSLKLFGCNHAHWGRSTLCD